MPEKLPDPEDDKGKAEQHETDDDDVLDPKKQKSTSEEEKSRRAPLPLAHRGTLCFYRVVTTLLLMMWIYLTPDNPSAFSCLIGSSEDSSCMSLLLSCQETTCSGWFHTNSPIPPNLGLIAMTQFALGTSVLWLWIALGSLLALFPSKPKQAEDDRSEKRHKWYKIHHHLPSMRTFQNTLSSLVKLGEAIGILCVAIVNIGVFTICIMTKDSTQTLGTGSYICLGPLLFLASQGMAPTKQVIRAEEKRFLRCGYRVWFAPTLMFISLFTSFSGRSRNR